MRSHLVAALSSVLLLFGNGAATATAQTAAQAAVPAAHPYAAFIAEGAQRFGIPENWIAAVMRKESAGDVRAISSAGAMGLMQVMPGTWASLRVRHGLGHNPYDPRDNIHAGTAYLRKMWDRYGNVAAMLAAYNAGPGRYDDYLANGRALPAETRAYVAALAPLLDGAAAPALPTRGLPRPPDWREAPLFVTQSSGHLAAVNSQSRNASAADPEPPEGGIFVARPHDGNAP